jgi:transposase
VRDDRPFGGSDPPIVVYCFGNSQARECVALHLEGYHGILQVDGDTAYQRLARPERAVEGVQLAACLLHLRRIFYELHVSDAVLVAERTLDQMAALWALDERDRGKPATTRILALREKSAADVGTSSAFMPPAGRLSATTGVVLLLHWEVSCGMSC